MEAVVVADSGVHQPFPKLTWKLIEGPMRRMIVFKGAPPHALAPGAAYGAHFQLAGFLRGPMGVFHMGFD